ncbi:ribosome-inactivating family protein [Streptomyces geranii]|uniref:ribosome-inactivating family protein n=1 Tax=Streptomyces geranii TaxID=2058923 RepID=UPI000D031D5C|nr:ribosome-inactivating family protein [Streptomyces geranii]
MTEPVIAEEPQGTSRNQRAVAPPRHRAGSLVHGAIAKPRTAALMAALVLALIGTLVGPFGGQKAHAEDGNPTYYASSIHGADYVAFINSIRNLISDGGSTSTRGTGVQVNHTMPNNPARYLQVDIHNSHNSEWVRLQFDRSNMYLLGWWDADNVYRYLGTRSIPQAERQRSDARHNNAAGWYDAASVSRVAGESYVDLERESGRTRAGMGWNFEQVDDMVRQLLRGSDTRTRARGALSATQFISEAVRFRPIRDSLALYIGANGHQTYPFPAGFVNNEQNWGALSARYNSLMRSHENEVGYRDPIPLWAWVRGENGQAVQRAIYTAIMYANYVLNTAKGR